MDHDTFLGQVQARAHLPSGGAATQATKATLQTLGERISAGAAEHLAAQLPQGIRDPLLTAPAEPDPFSVDEFLDRVTEREGVDKPDAVHHARVVLEVTEEATTGKLMDKVREQLPEDYQRLFAGSTGKMPTAP